MLEKKLLHFQQQKKIKQNLYIIFRDWNYLMEVSLFIQH